MGKYNEFENLRIAGVRLADPARYAGRFAGDLKLHDATGLAAATAQGYAGLMLAAALAGVGGALTALEVGHIDPEMAYWTTSGEFVFVAILSGTTSVAAPFLGAFLLVLLRSYAKQHAPNTWQLVMGATMLAVILFLPEGLWSIFRSRKRRAA